MLPLCISTCVSVHNITCAWHTESVIISADTGGGGGVRVYAYKGGVVGPTISNMAVFVRAGGFRAKNIYFYRQLATRRRSASVHFYCTILVVGRLRLKNYPKRQICSRSLCSTGP